MSPRPWNAPKVADGDVCPLPEHRIIHQQFMNLREIEKWNRGEQVVLKMEVYSARRN
jgi:hypothetical protein